MQHLKFVNWWIREFVVSFFDLTNRLFVDTSQNVLAWKGCWPHLNCVIFSSTPAMNFCQEVLMFFHTSKQMTLKVWILEILDCPSQPKLTFLPLQASKHSNFKTSSISMQFSVIKIQIESINYLIRFCLYCLSSGVFIL